MNPGLMKLILPLGVCADEAASLGDWEDLHGPNTTAPIEQRKRASKTRQSPQRRRCHAEVTYCSPYMCRIWPGHTMCSVSMQNWSQQLLSGVIIKTCGLQARLYADGFGYRSGCLSSPIAACDVVPSQCSSGGSGKSCHNAGDAPRPGGHCLL
jgi:hypothetical protein